MVQGILLKEQKKSQNDYQRLKQEKTYLNFGVEFPLNHHYH